MPGVGTTHFIRLLARFRTPRAVLRSTVGALAEVVGPALARRIKEYAGVANIEEQERRMAACGARLITLEDPDYPTHLAEIYDPPLCLFVRGELRESDARAVAVVGTRRATPYGLSMAEKFSRELAARGITVVSGLAAGIDAAAHRAAIEAEGRTIAVLGCGVDVAYPPENEILMGRVAQQGCVVSQFPMGVQPARGHFPYRNRIISGLSLGTLIIEAPLKSGALITARQAAEQGREVFAVPGPVGSFTSEGPHALIREGAKLVEKAEDILLELELPEELDAPFAPLPEFVPEEACEPEPALAARQAAPRPVDASPVEKKVLASLTPEGSHIDRIAAACRISISEALSSLTLLELKGLVRQFSGKRFAPR
ncbi:MAG: DNA-processing protein DprA [FCB group bacterium]|nr:DNA-processing protein DprA [FCB group bacterium]